MQKTTINSKTEQIETSLKYLANDKSLAVYRAAVGGGDVEPHQGDYIMQSVPIMNGRLCQQEWDLNQHGFVLLPMSTSVMDFYNDAQIDDIYKEEVKTLLIQYTGASRVETFDYTRRSSSNKIRKKKQIREAAAIVHNDYTAISGLNRLKQFLSESQLADAESLLNKNFAIVNVWRSINGPIYNYPLAMCDASSVAEDNLLAVKLESKERVGELQLAMYNSKHHWVYFPEMQIDEALIFKTFDSIDDGRARFTLHTSFDDLSVNKNVPPRESLETRCFVFFDDL